jgi:hypothetical protein
MSWVSNMGRRFLLAYTEGLVMTCPMHRAEAFFSGTDAPSAPAAIDRPQDNVQASLRPEYAGSFQAQSGSSLVH